MPHITARECEKWIQQFALARSSSVNALADTDIQKALQEKGLTASLFAIRQAKLKLASGNSVSFIPGGQQFPVPKVSRDVVHLGPLPELDPDDPFAEKLALDAFKRFQAGDFHSSPAVRSALWGLSNLRAAASLPRTLFFERASQGIEDFGDYARARYGEQGPGMLFALAELNKFFHGKAVKGDFRSLLIDPSVVSKTYLKDFCLFAMKQREKLGGSTPFQIRQAFADSLEMKSYYRALKLPGGMAEKLQKEIGMTCRAFRCLASYENLEERIKRSDPTVLDTRELADAPLATVLQHHIRPFSRTSAMRPWLNVKDKSAYLEASEKQLQLSLKNVKEKVLITKHASKTYEDLRKKDLARLKDGDAFLSVTEDERVALSVAANPEMAGTLKDGEAIYLFRLNLSPLDVLDPADYLGMGESPSHVSFGGGEKEVYTSSIEGIVAGHIHTFEIESFEPLKTAECKKFEMELHWPGVGKK